MPLANMVAGAPGDQFQTSTTKIGNPLGSAMQFADGRRYRMARAAGTAIGTGLLCAQTLNDATWDELVIPTARAIGDTTVTVTNEGTTAITVDLFADGYLNVEDDAGEGYLYTIKSNSAAATSGTCTVVLYEPLQVAWTTSTTVNLSASPYGRTIVHPSPSVTFLTGTTPRAIAASAYHWTQTWGPASVLGGTATTALVINENAVDHPTVDGAITGVLLTEGTPNTAGGQNVVGVVMEVAADTEYGIVYLKMS